jgi:hypothetical protein
MSWGVGFVSLWEALDLTTASGRALAGMLAIFAEFERAILRGPFQGRDRTGTPGGAASWGYFWPIPSKSSEACKLRLQ